MQIKVYNKEKNPVGQVEWPEALMEKVRPFRIHQVALRQLENRRQGNANVRSRHEVSGSTRKIYRQKGTGRARHGDIKAPLFVGGGRAFGPKQRDWSATLPQKIRRGALLDLVSLKRRDEKFWLIDSLTLQQPKTKEMALFFQKFGIPSGLLILGGENSQVIKSVRNLPRFKAVRIDSLNVLDLLRFDHLVMTQDAYHQFLKKVSS